MPDPPINLINNYASTSDVLISFLWDPPQDDGGSPILDYAVYYNQGSASNVWVVLDENEVNAFYQTTVALVAGETYAFKVTARNAVGSSDYSAEIQILAAKEPDAPISLAEISGLSTATQIGFSWQDGAYDGASPILDYSVSFRLSGATAYQVYASGLTSKDNILTGLTVGSTYEVVV